MATCRWCAVELTDENKIAGHNWCRDCNKEYQRQWREKNKEKLQQYRKWLPDDENYDDLKPISENWWGIITRR